MLDSKPFVERAERETGQSVLASCSVRRKLPDRALGERGVLCAIEAGLVFVEDAIVGPGAVTLYLREAIHGGTLERSALEATLVLDTEQGAIEIESLRSEHVDRLVQAAGIAVVDAGPASEASPWLGGPLPAFDARSSYASAAAAPPPSALESLSASIGLAPSAAPGSLLEHETLALAKLALAERQELRAALLGVLAQAPARRQAGELLGLLDAATKPAASDAAQSPPVRQPGKKHRLRPKMPAAKPPTPEPPASPTPSVVRRKKKAREPERTGAPTTGATGVAVPKRQRKRPRVEAPATRYGWLPVLLGVCAGAAGLTQHWVAGIGALIGGLLLGWAIAALLARADS
jgi:hypothetical protein